MFLVSMSKLGMQELVDLYFKGSGGFKFVMVGRVASLNCVLQLLTRIQFKIGCHMAWKINSDAEFLLYSQF